MDIRRVGIKRCQNMVKDYGLNPNIVKYLIAGKLYYSYGYSIDTIDYDPKYARAVKQFEHDHNAFVYHAIEYHDYSIVNSEGYSIKLYTESEEHSKLVLLYVGNDVDQWNCEEIYNNYAKAYCCNFNTPSSSGFCYVELSAPNGYISCSQLHFYREKHDVASITADDVLIEKYRRINTLRSQGMHSEIEFNEVYISYGEIVAGHAVGIIFDISEHPEFRSYLIDFTNDNPQCIPYFIMYNNSINAGNTISILYVSYDANMWLDERTALESKEPVAFVYDLERKIKGYSEITYLMCNGGPIQRR